jgi:hypothetical protein
MGGLEIALFKRPGVLTQAASDSGHRWLSTDCTRIGCFTVLYSLGSGWFYSGFLDLGAHTVSSEPVSGHCRRHSGPTVI